MITVHVAVVDYSIPLRKWALMTDVNAIPAHLVAAFPADYVFAVAGHMTATLPSASLYLRISGERAEVKCEGRHWDTIMAKPNPLHPNQAIRVSWLALKDAAITGLRATMSALGVPQPLDALAEVSGFSMIEPFLATRIVRTPPAFTALQTNAADIPAIKDQATHMDTVRAMITGSTSLSAVPVDSTRIYNGPYLTASTGDELCLDSARRHANGEAQRSTVRSCALHRRTSRTDSLCAARRSLGETLTRTLPRRNSTSLRPFCATARFSKPTPPRRARSGLARGSLSSAPSRTRAPPTLLACIA
jgi:hypothetical protein